MHFVGQVIDGSSVSQMDVIDHADLLESVERSVDGRDVDRREPHLDAARDVVGGQMTPGLHHGLDDGLSRRGAASGPLGEPGEDRFHVIAALGWCNHSQ
jgi:hypothetical protein